MIRKLLAGLLAVLISAGSVEALSAAAERTLDKMLNQAGNITNITVYDSSTGVGPAGAAKLRYSLSSNQLQVSLNGAAYAAVGGGVTDVTCTNQFLRSIVSDTGTCASITATDLGTALVPQFSGLGIGVAGVANKLMMPSGGIIDFNAANVTVTHSAGNLKAKATFTVWDGATNLVTLEGANGWSVFQSGSGVGWAATQDSTAAKDTTISRQAAGVVQIGTTAANALGTLMAATHTTAGTSGAASAWKYVTTTVNAAAAPTITATDLIPAGSLVFGVVTRVTTAFGVTNGLTSISIGDGTDADRWGATKAITLGATTTMADFTIASPVYYAAATSVVITGNGDGGNEFDTTGVIRVTVFYMDSTAPTS